MLQGDPADEQFQNSTECKQLQEDTHIQFCRQILVVHFKAVTGLVQAELDRFPTSLKMELDRFPTSLKMELNRFPTSLKMELDRFPTSLKMEQDRFPTSLKMELDRFPTSLKMELDRFPTSYRSGCTLEHLTLTRVLERHTGTLT